MSVNSFRKQRMAYYKTYKIITIPTIVTLVRWRPFSRDKDHNEIWYMQGGTIGKTTGLLNKNAEAEYLESFK